jgi:diguanylate cyclase (GGDEF)-like protein
MQHLIRMILLPLVIGAVVWWGLPQVVQLAPLPQPALVATLFVLSAVLVAMSLRFYQPVLISQVIVLVMLALALIMKWPGAAETKSVNYLLSSWALILVPVVTSFIQPLLHRQTVHLVIFALLAGGFYLLLNYPLTWPIRHLLPIGWINPLPYLHADAISVSVAGLALVMLLIRFFFWPNWIAQCLSLNVVLMVVLRFQAGADASTGSLLLAVMVLMLLFALLLDTHTLTYQDALTGIPNRRALSVKLAARSSKYSLAMLDVDHFKKFNDTHGHDVGDQVLKMVASQISKVGGGGKAFRYGGEEFTVLFNRMSAEQCVPYLEQIRNDIANYKLILRQKDRPEKSKQGKKHRGANQTVDTVQVTISMGIADQTHGANTDEVMEAADKALYAAKKAGRNKVKVFNS